jgi:hypothetical protein
MIGLYVLIKNFGHPADGDRVREGKMTRIKNGVFCLSQLDGEIGAEIELRKLKRYDILFFSEGRKSMGLGSQGSMLFLSAGQKPRENSNASWRF